MGKLSMFVGVGMDIDLPYLSRNKDRHGNVRLYARRNGGYVRIREKPGTPEFLAAYAAALERLGAPKDTPGPNAREQFPKGTLGWLGTQYFASEEFKALDAQSQKTRRGVIEECFEEPHKDDDPERIGNCPLVHLAARHIKRLRDLKMIAGLKGAANNRRKYLSAMFGWAVEQDPPLLKSNPARDVRRVRYATSGFHTWTPDEVQQFEERHPVGTKARLALALLLYTGARRGDMVKLGKQHVREGWLRFVPNKTLYKRDRTSEKPWLPCLAEIVAASPCGDLTYLVTEYGKPFTAKGFGNWFRDRCNEAGLPQCTAHGLRKAGATLAAENGATTNQLMAIFDWDTPAQAKVYTEAADRKRMAGEAMPMLART
jgi:integrase